MSLFEQLEQFQSALRDIAPILHSYYFNLIRRGFSEQQAFDLTKDMQRMIFRQE